MRALRGADLEDLRAADRAGALRGRAAVLHRDLLRVLDLARRFALDAITGRHRDLRRGVLGIVVTAQLARRESKGAMGETIKEISEPASGRASHARG